VSALYEWLGAVLAFLFIGVPALLGYFLLYVGLRFKRSAGVTVDQTAFWTNWLVWVWCWAERAKEIVKAMPFFSKDLSENFGVKPDDGRIT